MYPNPQDVLPLPPHPDIEQYRTRAKDLARACRSGDDAIVEWARRWIKKLSELQPDAGSADMERRVTQVAEFARERMTAANCRLSQAQFVIARAHGFPSWPKLVHHIEGIASGDERRSAFERAADAIVAGDISALDRLLRIQSDLIRARSDREHHATLLHYVSANGVENYRQKTPANIVDIARRLLDAGANVNAEADVYGGGATTLGLVLTSMHPRLTGVQIELADLLLERGARIDTGIVRSCLMNGFPEAAAHMAAFVPSLTLEEAAGIGRVDSIAGRFESGDVTNAEAARALIMASWYDQRDIVELLLDSGVDVAARGDDGETALHIAAYQGHAQLVDLLIGRGAPVDVTDDGYHTPPVVWALHAWLVENRTAADSYRRVVLSLVDAGARVKPEWVDDDRIRSDPELYAALASRST